MDKGILIADAGSSKTNWSFISDKTITPVRLNTPGINPAHDDIDVIRSYFSDISISLSESTIQEINFFGAGCATPLLKKTVAQALAEAFPSAFITVESDLVGAARALFGDENGIACILGTGANTGLFVNGRIEMQIPAMGYILGDEGSGFALGKALLNSIFKKQLSFNLQENFFETYNLTLDSLIERVYRQPKPAPFVASFTPFLSKNKDNPEIRNLVIEEFDKFFEKNIKPYSNKTILVGFVGSIAFNFSDLLIESGAKFGVTISKIISDPISALELYYKLK